MDPQLYFDPKAGNSLLHRIVSQGEEATALNLLNQGADYTIQNSVGQTPLHTAFYNNMFEVVERILAEYKNFENNPIDSNGLSYLHIASSVYGRVGSASVQHLIEIGADVNQCVSHDSQFYPGYTALHFAAEWGRSHNARALLKNGAKYSLQNNLNETAFDLALSRAQFDQEPSSYDVMREIVLQDMQSNDLNFINYGFTPLHLLEHDATSKYINTICAKYNFDVNGKTQKSEKFQIKFRAFVGEKESLTNINQCSKPKFNASYKNRTSRMKHSNSSNVSNYQKYEKIDSLPTYEARFRTKTKK
ncbi:hypothetical protein QAD02_021573 [Eretmocerus hayati]|uniref:Uncharacterized protein n=1 Tax=Eretmocerus hayati TaxID=131215 RepID=A0ACC2PQB0_9HYME|nr:hypothetical protein QAD02_021573 [Eretmocerus hayati]